MKNNLNLISAHILYSEQQNAHYFNTWGFQTRIFEIRGEYPGVGKTSVMLQEFLKRYYKNKSDGSADTILTTTANRMTKKLKASLRELTGEDFSKKVMTITKFSRNYKRIEKNKHHIYVQAHMKKRYPKKPIDLFIDEVGMISETAIEDILECLPIRNLVYNGDNCQFNPIGSEVRILNDKGEVEHECYFSEETFKGRADKTILLNQQLRSQEPELNYDIREVKMGHLNKVLSSCKQCPAEYKLDVKDTHICYFKKTSEELNTTYEEAKKVKRYIAVQNNSKWELFKGEIYTENDDGFLEGEGRILPIRNTVTGWEFANPSKEYPIEFKDVKDHTVFANFDAYFKPCVAVNIHKLQGDTIKEGRIFIHVDDCLELLNLTHKYQNLENGEVCIVMTEEEIKEKKEYCAEKGKRIQGTTSIKTLEQIQKENEEFRSNKGKIKKYGEVDLWQPLMTEEKVRKAFHTFVYVAISRAVSKDQIYICGWQKIMDKRNRLVDAIECRTAKGEDVSKYLKELELLDSFINQKPLEEDLGENVVECSAVNCECNFDYDDGDYLAECKHQIYTHRKPRCKKWSDEKLLEIPSLKKLKKLTKDVSVIRKWKKLHPVKTPKYNPIEKVVKIVTQCFSKQPTANSKDLQV